MSKARATELIDFGDKLFSDKRPLDLLNQEIAENVYPERADFTRERYLGENFADHLMDSFPVLARRELGNSLSAILRPRDRAWFRTSTLNKERDNQPDNSQFLEYMTEVIKSAIYHPKANFIAATKTGDHDFVSFGNAILSVEEGPTRDHLFFRAHHPRDCAWLENEISVIDHLHRKDKFTARQLRAKFGDKNLADPVKRAADKEPSTKVNVRCIVMPAEEYDSISSTTGSGSGKGRKQPFVVLYIDADNQKVMREGGMHDFTYVVPRWHRISGWQYAFSAAALTSLPDARMGQMLASIILEAGEKMIEPPLAAIEDVVKEASLQSGSITWVDAEFEGPVSNAIAPMKIEGDMRVGFEMRKDVRDMLTREWFLDKLSLPEAGKQMTAYEVSQRLEEHVRNLLPIIEPMEVEYNTQLLDKAFSVLMNMKAFDFSQMPDGLSKTHFSWAFMNPMQEASSRILVSQFAEAGQLVAGAMQQFQVPNPLKPDLALDDALRGTGMPSTWHKSVEEMAADAKAKAAQDAKAQQQQQMMQTGATIAGAAGVAHSVGQAAKSLREGGVLPPAGSQAPGQPQGQPVGQPRAPPPAGAPQQQAA